MLTQNKRNRVRAVVYTSIEKEIGEKRTPRASAGRGGI